MTSHDKHQAALWDLAVQRAVADAEYRARLLTSAPEALAEVGLDCGGLEIVVHELTERLRVIVLPPRLGTVDVPPDAAGGVRPYSAEPPSASLAGSAWCALSDPADPRATYVKEANHG